MPRCATPWRISVSRSGAAPGVSSGLGPEPAPQREMAKAAQSLIEFPPIQKGAGFNLEAVKERIKKAIAAQHGP